MRTSWRGTCCTSVARRRPSAARTAPSALNMSATSRHILITGTSIYSRRYLVSLSVNGKRAINTAGSDSPESARSRKTRTVFFIGNRPRNSRLRLKVHAKIRVSNFRRNYTDDYRSDIQDDYEIFRDKCKNGKFLVRISERCFCFVDNESLIYF